MAELDWGLLKTPDFFGNALLAQEAGRQRRLEDDTNAALRGYLNDPKRAIDALMQVNPAEGIRRQQEQDERARTRAQEARESFVLLERLARGVENDAQLEALKANPMTQRLYGTAAAAMGLDRPLSAVSMDDLRWLRGEVGGAGQAQALDPTMGLRRL